MYKMVLVDDEHFVRKGLLYFLDWKSLGFEIVADFEDGKDALAFLSQNPADVVLTDIGMAELDGLALAKHLYETSPHVKVVLISGLQDFEYAKKAIEYKVEHYLLKPTKFDEMQRVFLDLKAKMDKEREMKAERERGQARLDELLPLLQEQFFNDLAMGAFRMPEDIVERCRKLGLSMDPAATPCCLIDVEIAGGLSGETPEQRTKLMRSLESLFLSRQQGIRYYRIFSFERNLKLLAVWFDRGPSADLRRELDAELHHLSVEIARIFDIAIRYTSLVHFDNLFELSAYSKPLQLVFEQSRGVGRLEDVEYEKLAVKYKLFLSHAMEGNLDEALNLLNRFLDDFRELPISYAHRLVMDVFAIAIKQLSEQGVHDQESLKKRFQYHHVVELTDLEDIRRWAARSLGDLLKLFAQRKETNIHQSVESAKRYILQNFTRDLTLEEVADHVFLHPIYLSRIFKQSTGMNYIDYLTRLRIQKAAELLSTGEHKIYEVTEMVGYRSREYFTRLFKKVTGFSPKQYARNIHENAARRVE